MRLHPFRAGTLVAALLGGLLALAPRGAVATTVSVPGLGSTELSLPGGLSSAPALAAGEAPAFAGRVDPDTYRVGPGDEFAFRSSDLIDPKIVRVGPAGEILLPDLGPIAVAGLTLSEMEARVREALRPYVRGKGFVLTLHRPRRFLAMVVGAVRHPGAVPVQAPVRASEAIAAAGGIAWPGARRGIVLRRGADTLWVDLDRFERSGDLATNPLVFETDVLVVPPASKTIDVLGAVGQPGRYDLAPGDRPETAIAAAGGLLDRAARDRIVVSRERVPGLREEFPASPSGADAEGTEFLLEPGDQIVVPERAHWAEGASVALVGEVSFPGPYPIVDGVDRLGALLRRAGGFTAWADSAALRVERETGAALRDSAFVRLAREEAGVLNDHDREYLISLTRENRALSLSAVAWTQSGRSADDLLLMDGDRIVVPRRTLTVLVQGEVRAPGHVPLQGDRGVSDYVAAAGGYTGRAKRGAVRVTLAATGRQVGAGDVGTLHAGDIVWVPAREPRSFWGSVKDILTTTAQAATIYLVVREATR